MPTDAILTAMLVAAGAALALVGAARAAGLVLPAMPRRLALAAVGAGAAVMGLGLFAPALLEAPEAPGRMPEIALEPATPPPGEPLPDTGPGRVTGTVRDVHGEPVQGANVTLRRFEATAEASQTQTSTSPDGAFAFNDLRAGPTDAYIVTTSFQGTDFPSDVLIPAVEQNQEVNLVVAPTTDDPSVVEVDLDSTLLTGGPDGLDVLQILRVRVRADRAFSGGLRLPVLDGAFSFEPRRGIVRQMLRFDEADRLTSDAPVLPGETEIVYGYLLPPPTEEATLVRQPDYPTRRLDLLVSGPLLIQADTLTPAADVPIGPDRRARRLTAYDVEAGTRVEAAVSLPRPATWPRTALLAAGIAVALGILLFPLVRRGRRGAVGQE